MSQWCHTTISSSVYPFSSCPQYFPASVSLQMSQLFASDGLMYWSFSISPSNKYSRLISFNIDWFDLLAVQGTHKSVLQYHNSKASILQHSAFFMIQRSHLYITNGKNPNIDSTDLCRQSDVSAFSMLSRLVMAFLPRRKHLLILWLQ